MKKETSVFCFLLNCVLSHRKVSMTGSNHVDAIQTPIFSHPRTLSCRLDAAENLLARLWETITTSLPWCYSLFLLFPKGAVAGHCHLEDIKLTGDLMSSLRPPAEHKHTQHGSRAVTWFRPSVASPIKLVKSQVTQPWNGTPQSLGQQGWVLHA